MPLLKLQTTVPVSEEKANPLIKACSKIVARVTGKSENYVMVLLDQARGSLAGEIGAMAFVDVRGIGGMTAEVNAGISEEICSLLKKELRIDGDKVYLTFTDVPATNWGWNGQTFG